MGDHRTSSPTFGPTTGPDYVPSWMTVDEARAVLAATPATALPVVGHAGLIGLVTVEALGAPGVASGAPVCEVMDWHLVQVPTAAGEEDTLVRFIAAARRWLTTRHLDAQPPQADPGDPPVQPRRPLAPS